jgi:hypothetical protein
MMRVLMAILLCASAVAVAGEKKIEEKDVPKAALDSVAKKYPNAKRVGFERELEGKTTTYEIKIVDGARKLEVELSPDGKITAEEEVIDIKGVPAVVRDALAKSPKWGKWTVKKVERVIKNEKTEAPQFEFHVVQNTAKAEVVFDKDGALVSTEGGSE